MIKEIIMPKLGETMEEGYLVNWKKKKGEKIEQGDVLFEVMSDKTNFEVESQYSGYVRKILCEPSDKAIPVTTVIGYISNSLDEEIPKTEEKTSVTVEEEKRIKITPLARKTASEKGIDIAGIKGTGPGGRIEKKDVLAHAEKTGEKKKVHTEEQHKAEYSVKEWSPIRKIIAERLTQSKNTIPHYYTQGKIIVDAIARLKEIQKEQGLKFSYTDFIIFFCSKAIKEYPLINAGVINGEIRIYKSVNVGVAMAVEDGLVVPVIKNCDKKSIKEISEERKNLVLKARDNKLGKEDTEGGRFVVSNLGMFGVENFQAIINPPGVAIMAVGSIGKIPLVLNDTIEIHSVMNISLSFDHRIIDGAYGGKFFQRLKELMENPEPLIL